MGLTTANRWRNEEVTEVNKGAPLQDRLKNYTIEGVQACYEDGAPEDARTNAQIRWKIPRGKR